MRDFFYAALVFFALAVTVALLQGCATFGSSTVPPRVGQEQAVWVVWRFYERYDIPPTIRWREGAQLTCEDPQSHKRGFVIATLEDPGFGADGGVLQCREGLTWSPLEVLVAWHGELSFSETALAHELLHAVLLRQGIWTSHHERPDFFSRVEAANNLLKERGL